MLRSLIRTGTPPRPHPLARSKTARWLSANLARAWDRGWMDRVPLDPQSLWARAYEAVDGGSEIGGRQAEDLADYRARLEMLCDSLAGEAALNPLGRAMAYGQLLRALKHRLQLGGLWQRAPHLAQTPIAAPIIVVGQMRAGTTRIHRLLAADPAHAATRFCDSWNPVPPREGDGMDTRPLRGAATLLIARQLDPWIDALHPMGSTRGEEELGWLACALDHCAYEAQWRIPAFVQWSEARDPGPVYAEFARILRTDAAHRGNADRPRVLKVPQFAEDLAALLNVFPDARVVVARRSEEDVVRSAASLVANQMAMQSNHADMDWIRSEAARKIALREDRTRAALAAFSGPVAHARFEALNEDWRAEISAIYADLGLKLSDEAVRAMAREQARAAKSAHRDHAHQMRGFRASGDGQ